MHIKYLQQQVVRYTFQNCVLSSSWLFITLRFIVNAYINSDIT
jgi:hypothetical protein